MKYQFRRGIAAFTLIEMIVAIAVLSILLLIAVPSFLDYRARAALRGAADQVAVFWGDARFEAVRRNSVVKVGFVSGAGGAFCLGAEVPDDAADTEACNCLVAGSCNVAAYPPEQSEWRGVRVAADATTGGGTGKTGVVYIDPKRGTLTDPDDAGLMQFRSPASGNLDYRLNVAINRMGRAVLCEPSDAPDKLSQYADRRCDAGE